jgi:hypothetical protein
MQFSFLALFFGIISFLTCTFYTKATGFQIPHFTQEDFMQSNGEGRSNEESNNAFDLELFLTASPITEGQLFVSQTSNLQKQGLA